MSQFIHHHIYKTSLFIKQHIEIQEFNNIPALVMEIKMDWQWLNLNPPYNNSKRKEKVPIYLEFVEDHTQVGFILINFSPFLISE